MIRDNNTHMLQNVISTSRKEGMQSMDMCLQNLYQQAVITYDVALSHARDPERIARK